MEILARRHGLRRETIDRLFSAKPPPRARGRLFFCDIATFEVCSELYLTQVITMVFNLKKTSLLILGITALVCSRTLFALFDDPEGPNLLIITVMAAILFAASLAAYKYNPLAKLANSTKLLLAILVQALLVTVLYFSLR